MKNAYNQGLECDHGDDEGGDDGVSPKDVGHNIYILAHQVSHFISLHYSANIINYILCHYLLIYFPSSASFTEHSPLLLWAKVKERLPAWLTLSPGLC